MPMEHAVPLSGKSDTALQGERVEDDRVSLGPDKEQASPARVRCATPWSMYEPLKMHDAKILHGPAQLHKLAL